MALLTEICASLISVGVKSTPTISSPTADFPNLFFRSFVKKFSFFELLGASGVAGAFSVPLSFFLNKLAKGFFIFSNQY